MGTNIKVRDLEELDPLEALGIIDMSYSRMDTYKMCPLKYFYNYIDKKPGGKSGPALLGNVIHSALENTIGDGPMVLSEILNAFEGFKDEVDTDQLIDKSLEDAGRAMLMEFFDKHSDEEIEVLGREIGFSFVLGSTLIRGYIDRIDKEKDSIRIVDYKSGKTEVAAKNIKENLQVGIYVLAASRMYPDVNHFWGELYYLRSGRRKDALFTREDLPELISRVHEEIGVIINDKFFHPTSNRRICGFCSYAADGTCPTGKYRLNK